MPSQSELNYAFYTIMYDNETSDWVIKKSVEYLKAPVKVNGMDASNLLQELFKVDLDQRLISENFKWVVRRVRFFHTELTPVIESDDGMWNMNAFFNYLLIRVLNK